MITIFPSIYDSEKCPMEDAAAVTADFATQQQSQSLAEDVPCFFDTRIVDANARPYRNKAPEA